jgi:hypothetical protein
MHLLRGELRKSYELAEQMLCRAQSSRDPTFFAIRAYRFRILVDTPSMKLVAVGPGQTAITWMPRLSLSKIPFGRNLSNVSH